MTKFDLPTNRSARKRVDLFFAGNCDATCFCCAPARRHIMRQICVLCLGFRWVGMMQFFLRHNQSRCLMWRCDIFFEKGNVRNLAVYAASFPTVLGYVVSEAGSHGKCPSADPILKVFDYKKFAFGHGLPVPLRKTMIFFRVSTRRGPK